MPRVLVTGSSGLVGSNIVRYFYGKGWDVIAASSTKGLVSCVEGIEVIEYQLDTALENELLHKKLVQSDAVIHCAAILPSKDSSSGDQLFKANITGVYDLQKIAAKMSKYVIFISRSNIAKKIDCEITEHTLPEPEDEYQLSKYLGEEIIKYFMKTRSAKSCILRISAPYGYGYKRKAVIPLFLEKALRGEDLEVWGGGKRQQVFTYVEDIAIACFQAIEKNVCGTFNITSGESTSMEELAKVIIRLVKNNITLQYRNIADPEENVIKSISIRAAHDQFGYSPRYNIKSGVADMIQHMRSAPKELFTIK